MKIAVVSESPADEAAIKILVDAVLESQTELVSAPRLRPHGWSHVLTLLPTIIKHLHYRTDVEGFVVVLDTDESEIHDQAHETSDEGTTNCRLCQMRRAVSLELDRLQIVPNRPRIKYALGVAVPAIEAWYQCGIDTHVNEATWRRKQTHREEITYNKESLKRAVYGSDRPDITTETRNAMHAAERLATDLDSLERLFPNGFGSLLRDLRGWVEG